MHEQQVSVETLLKSDDVTQTLMGLGGAFPAGGLTPGGGSGGGGGIQ